MEGLTQKIENTEVSVAHGALLHEILSYTVSSSDTHAGGDWRGNWGIGEYLLRFHSWPSALGSPGSLGILHSQPQTSRNRVLLIFLYQRRGIGAWLARDAHTHNRAMEFDQRLTVRKISKQTRHPCRAHELHDFRHLGIISEDREEREVKQYRSGINIFNMLFLPLIMELLGGWWT